MYNSNLTSKPDSVFIGDIGKINLKKSVNNLQTKIKSTGVIKTASALQNKAKNLNGKEVALAIPRRAFRTLVSINFRGLATMLSKDLNKSKTAWAKVGGSWSELEKSINIGKKRKILSPNLNDKISIGSTSANGSKSTSESLQSIASIIALAEPIIGVIMSLFGSLKDSKKGSTGQSKTDSTNLFFADSSDTTAPASENSSNSSNLLLFGGIALVSFLAFKK